jgi:hypothetical protein
MSDAYDWIFDYALQFLESDKFDAAVMDFVDEKCEVFDSEEENKFVYSDIHNEYRDHIDTLITSNLSEVGITSDMFYESCEKGRQNRDINRAVFERMLSMEDFNTFKRIMVKRNMELQLMTLQGDITPEASPMKGKFADGGGLMYTMASPMSPEEEKAQIEKALSNSLKHDELDQKMSKVENQDVQELLRSSLMEMEMLHRQEELEQQELERAMALSLAIEEERLNMLQREMKEMQDELQQELNDIENSLNEADMKDSDFVERQADSKEELNYSTNSSETKDSSRDSKGVEAKNSREDASIASTSASASTETITRPKKPKKSTESMSSNADAKGTGMLAPLKPLKPLKQFNALPPIARGQGLSDASNNSHNDISKMSAELENKKREAEMELQKNRDQLARQRQEEVELRKELEQQNNSPGLEADKRAKYMREQRDKLIAMKKAERDRKVKEEEEINAKKNAEKKANIPEDFLRMQAKVGTTTDESNDAKGSYMGISKADIEESRRGAMRNALARRMKMSLAVSEEDRIAKEQFGDLEVKLQQIGRMREDSMRVSDK